MKIAQGMKIISKGWVQKPKGYRVKYCDHDMTINYSPDLDNAPLDSDVTAWRYAWKLYKSTKSDQDTVQEDELVNITVVDTEGNDINYYVTGTPKIYNKKE
ncbi:MAG: hypothetical protein ABFR31_01245 [Thermodesulfobacteriota bacterium]